MVCVEEGLVERERTALEDFGVERGMQTASPGHLKTANVIAKSGDRFEARPASRAEHT